MTIYNVINCVYDCDERFCHDGDPTIYVRSYSDLVNAQNAVKEIVAKYQAELDEDGEPNDHFDCEIDWDNGTAVCTSESIQAVINIEETELDA